MGIVFCCPMAWKMLEGAQNPLPMKAFRDGSCQLCNLLGIVSKGSISYHRIFLICYHIGIRSKIHIKAKLPKIPSDGRAGFIGLS